MDLTALSRASADLVLLALVEAEAAPGPQQDPLEALLARVLRRGTRTLYRLARQALARLLPHGPVVPLAVGRLFDDAERAELTAALAATRATAGLLGRALVRDRAARAARLPESVPASAPLAVPIVRQSTAYSCGAACLAAVCRFHGLKVDEADVGRRLGTDPRDGTRPREIVAVARRLGLEVQEQHDMEVEDLAVFVSQGKPVLCPIQRHGGGHWVVVTGVAPPWVQLMNPALGVEVIRLDGGNWSDEDADGRTYRRYGLALGPPAVRASRLIEALAVPPTPLAPEQAVAYFGGLVPELGVDPQRYGPDLRRQAFTLAVATEHSLLARVQDLIRTALQTGQRYTEAPRDLARLLADAGVTPARPGYSSMVFRTNAMDAYNQGAYDALRDPDVGDAFPVWQYSAVADSRSRPHHAARDGNYYPASVPFVQVRGTSIADSANCRCTFIPVDKWSWRDLKRRGARIARGYPDVPAGPPAPARR